jgi:hypothetical protein
MLLVRAGNFIHSQGHNKNSPFSVLCRLRPEPAALLIVKIGRGTPLRGGDLAGRRRERTGTRSPGQDDTPAGGEGGCRAAAVL